MNRKIILAFSIIVTVIFIAVLGLFGFKKYEEMTTPPKIHYHAGFVIFKDNQKFNFSDFKYMKVEPCTAEKNKEHTEEDEQMEKAHLHDNVGDVIHVEEENARWSDVFTNLHVSVNPNNVKGYEDGVEIKDFYNSEINSYQSVVIFIGDNDSSHIKEQVTVPYIKSKETTSEDCGS